VNRKDCLIPSIQACGELADQIEHGQPSFSRPRGPQIFLQDWTHVAGIPIRTGGAGYQKTARKILNDLDGAMKIAGKGPLREVCCEDVRTSKSVDYFATKCCKFHQGSDRLNFETSFGHYYEGMNVSLARNFQPAGPTHHKETAKIVRTERLRDGKWGVAIRIL